MQSVCIIVTLDKDEFHALLCLSKIEYRPMKDQLRYLLRREAQHRQLLPPEQAAKASPVAVADTGIEQDEVII